MVVAFRYSKAKAIWGLVFLPILASPLAVVVYAQGAGFEAKDWTVLALIMATALPIIARWYARFSGLALDIVRSSAPEIRIDHEYIHTLHGERIAHSEIRNIVDAPPKFSLRGVPAVILKLHNRTEVPIETMFLRKDHAAVYEACRNVS